jgi:Domain of unknown function (DUF6434)/SAP domain-containing new25
MKRPDFSNIKTATEFNNWYWLKEEMVAICKATGLPATGSKFQLRDRIMYALDNNGTKMPEPVPKKPTAVYDWAKGKLTPETIITDNVSFGPNFRNFIKLHVGNKFVCHSDFMNWIKSNTGKTLQDAILMWQELENRKKNPNFKRNISEHNMLAQYVKDFLKDNPGKKIKDVLAVWKIKKTQPMINGFVKYKKADVKLINK